VNLLLQDFKNGPNKENLISKHGIKFPLFFHFILGQREQDPLAAFIIALKKERRDLNLNPENPRQEKAVMVASGLQRKKVPCEWAVAVLCTQYNKGSPLLARISLLRLPCPLFPAQYPGPQFLLSSPPPFLSPKCLPNVLLKKAFHL
jgi:hypothetical protein